MAEDLSQLKKTWLFEARMAQGAANLIAQKEWLWEEYKKIKGDGSSEVTSTSFQGQSASMQHRGASPQDHLQAIQAAIEDLEAQIESGIKASAGRPFGFRFDPAPANIC